MPTSIRQRQVSYPIPRLPWPATLAHNDHLGSSDLARYRLPSLPWNISVSGSSTSSLSRLCHAKVCSCPTVSISPSTVHPGACGLLTRRVAAGRSRGHGWACGWAWQALGIIQTVPNSTKRHEHNPRSLSRVPSTTTWVQYLQRARWPTGKQLARPG